MSILSVRSPALSFKTEYKIRGLRLQPQGFDPIPIGFVMNEQPDLILRAQLDIGDVEIYAAR